MASTFYEFGNGSPAAPTVATAPGLASFNYAPAFGGQPQLPDPNSTAALAISGNNTNLPGVSQLVTGQARANAAAAKVPFQANLPNYDALVGKQSSNIMSELEGVLPPDVLAILKQQGGERGVSTGSPGSPNSDAAFLQSLGLTSLGLEQTGAADLARAIGETPTGPAVNAASSAVTPAQEQAAGAGQSIYNSAPIPAYAASANAAASRAGRAAGADSVNQPGQPPTIPQSPSYAGQNTPAYGGTAIGSLDAGTASQLSQFGFSQEEIAGMSPEQAAAIVNSYNSPATGSDYPNTDLPSGPNAADAQIYDPNFDASAYGE